MTNPIEEQVRLPGAFSLLKPSWAAVRLNLVTFAEFVIIEGIIQIMSSTLASKYQGSALMLNLVANLLSILIAPGLVLLRLRSVRGEKADISTVLGDGLKFAWRFFLMSICIAFLVIVGLILFIVPGVIMIRRYYLAPFYLVDRNMGVFEAMRASAADSKQFKNGIYGVMLVAGLFAILSIVLVGFVLLAMYYCADAIRYVEISAATGKK